MFNNLIEDVFILCFLYYIKAFSLGRSLSIFDRMYSESYQHPIEHISQRNNIRGILANTLSLIVGFD